MRIEPSGRTSTVIPSAFATRMARASSDWVNLAGERGIGSGRPFPWIWRSLWLAFALPQPQNQPDDHRRFQGDGDHECVVQAGHGRAALGRMSNTGAGPKPDNPSVTSGT